MNPVITPMASTGSTDTVQGAASPGTWRLKNHVFFREAPNGVHFDAGKQGFVLSGAGQYPLVARVLSLMDQRVPLQDIEKALPARLRPHYERLLAALRAHDMLLEDAPDQALLDALDAPAPLQEFVKYLQDQLPADAYRPKLSAWRTAGVLVVGQGQVLKAAAKALADSGVGHLSVRTAEHTEVVELEDHVRSAGVRGQTVDVRLSPASDADFAAASLALFASDAWDSSAAALAFDREAAALGTPCLVACRFGGHAHVLPMAEPGVAGLPELLQWRQADDDVPHSPASLALLGALAAQQALAWHFGIGLDRARRQAHRVTPYFEIEQHPLVGGRADARTASRGALAPLPEAAHRAKLGVPAERTLAPYEQVRLRLAPWFDPITGPLAFLNHRTHGIALAQLPLYHEAVVVRAPHALPGDPGAAPAAARHVVVGWGLNAEQAGLRALALALTRLAQSCKDRSQGNAGPFPSFLDPLGGPDARRQVWGRSEGNAGPFPSFLDPLGGPDARRQVWGRSEGNAGPFPSFLDPLGGPAQAAPATMVAAFDREQFDALAVAHAVAAAPEFAAKRHVAWVDPAAADDAVLHLLRQLLRHFIAEPHRLLLHWHPHHHSVVAQCLTGEPGAEQVLASACHTTARAALQEAVGLACSRLQVSDDRVERPSNWLWAPAQPSQWQAAPGLDGLMSKPSRPVVARWELADELALPPGVFCGRAVLQVLHETAPSNSQGMSA